MEPCSTSPRKNPPVTRLPINRPWRSGNTTRIVSMSPSLMSSSSRSGASVTRSMRGSCLLVPDLFGGRVGGRDAAVEDERLAGHERRLVRGEEQGAVHHLLGLAEATHGDVDEAALTGGVVGEVLGQQRREHRARA